MLAGLLAAALAAAAPPLSRAEVAACLGTPRFATNMETLAKARAEVSPAAWDDACRAAREADGRRRSAIRVLFETGQAPIAGYASATKYSRLAHAASDPLHRELFRHVARDQAARESNQRTEKAGFAPGVSPLALRLVDAISSGDGLRADAASRTWLLATVDRRGWFTISRDGEAADNAAWLIAQHADADPIAQRRLVDVIEPLAARGDSHAGRFGLLYDRWARNAGEPQRFGFQGDCIGPGVWKPRPIADEAGLEARRRQAGLPPMAEYMVDRAKTCR